VTALSADAADGPAGDFVVTSDGVNAVEVAGTDGRFPIRRVYCLGRNYSAHAIEMGDDPDNNPPFFFMKPSDAVYPASEDFPYPTMSNRVGFEMELVVALASGGNDIEEKAAKQHVYGYGVGLDMTRRDLQDEAKELSRPWEGGKAFDRSAPMSPIYPVADIGHPEDNRIWLSVNDDIRQDSTTARMRWDVSRSIAILSRYFELRAGDLIFSGTPAGVGLIERGDTIRGGVEGVAEIEVVVT
jgi:fumarylpyruvate hydrolase